MFTERVKVGDREVVRPVDPPEWTRKTIDALIAQQGVLIENNQRMLEMLCDATLSTLEEIEGELGEGEQVAR